MAELRKNQLNTRAAGVVAIAVMCSRVLGLVREMLFAGLFGSQNMGQFIVAFRVPNMLRDLFAEGALSTAFVTVFSRRIEKEGDAAAWRLASKVVTLAAVFMTLVVVLGILFSRPLMSVLAPGFEGETLETTIWLTQVMFPFILMVSLAALAMGILNAKNVFGIPAMASSFFNIGSIAGGVAVGYWIDPRFGPAALTGLAVGTLLGGALQLLVQLPSLGRVGFRFVPDFRWRDSGVREVLVLMTPAVIAASAVQVNVYVNTVFASLLGSEAVSWLNWAFRLMQLPLGVFGVAVATVTLPVVSRIAVTGDMAHFRETMGKALRLAVFLTVPAACGLAILADPIICLLYERGKTVRYDTLETGAALRYYALGLAAYACVKVLAPAFYALDRKWMPMLVSFGSIGLNLVLNWMLAFKLGMGHRGLAFSTAISATANFLLLYLLMRGLVNGLETRQFLDRLLRTGVASAALAGVSGAGLHYLSDYLFSPSLLTKAVALFAVITAAIIVYLAVSFVLQIPELKDAIALVQRRLRR